MYKLFLILLAVFIFSCAPNGTDVRIGKEGSKELRSNNKDVLVFEAYKDHTIFYSESQNKFFQIQHENKPELNGAYEFVEYSSEVFKIREISTKSIMEFSFLESSYHSIYGLGDFSGSTYNENFLTQTGENIDISDDPQALSCKCEKNGTEPDCEHGGEGANSCSVTDGGSVGVGRTNECSVSCNDGYYACCNELVAFDDGNE